MQQATNGSEGQDVPDGTGLRREVAAATPAEREKILAETIRELASAVLEQPVFELDSSFLENGLTSLRALELTHKLTALTDIEIPLVALIENSTPTRLGRFMAESYAAALR